MTPAEDALRVLHDIFTSWIGVEQMKLRNVSPRTLGRALAQMDMRAAWAEECSRVHRA